MNRRYSALFVFFLLAIALRATAQPTLPDIAGIGGEGSVILSWTCQYEKVKAITVMRSGDSLGDFEVIGYVKKTGKGVQGYIDNKTTPGKYYYKLAIVFSSGLTWRSNFVGVNVTRSVAKRPKQPEIEKETDKPTVGSKPDPSQFESSFKVPDTCKKATPGVVIAITPDSAISHKPEAPKPKLSIPYEELNENTPIFIKSKYIYTDSATGHVDMMLPGDVNTHHYSVKFFDKDKRLITEVPKINSPNIIIDKRNFQRKGVYKFTLRKDYTELESGYIIIDPKNPNP